MRLPGGRLPAAAARELAAMAVGVGAGPFELTNRGNLQLRGIPLDAVPLVRDLSVACGMALADPGADERRDVMASPTAGVDALELIDTRPLVSAIADRLGSVRAVGLSPKFGVLVDGAGAVHVRGRNHDVALGALRCPDGSVQYEVRLADSLPLVHAPDDAVWLVNPERALDVVDAAIDVCAPLGRAGAVADATGQERVWDDLVRRSSGALTMRHGRDVRLTVGPSEPAVGVHRQRQAERVWVGCVPVLGRLDAVTLAALAELAARAAVGDLRVTPWRSVVFTDVAERDAETVVVACDELGLVCDPLHPANLVVACAGSRGCAGGLADTQADARVLVDRLASVPAARRPGSVHVSGCEKGCARPQPAEFSIVAGPAESTYDLYAAGTTGSGGRFGDRVETELDPHRAIEVVLARGRHR